MARKPAPPPLKSATKDEWVGYAIDRGVPSYTAWDMTKPELVKHFTGEDIPDDEPPAGGAPAPKKPKGA